MSARDEMTTRYQDMFDRLTRADRPGFIPFVQLGDPHDAAITDRAACMERSVATILGLIEAGADALELGVPFSDPIADGPTIQAAAQRALRAGITPDDALEIVAQVRAAHPDVPIGLLVYANLVVSRGLDRFYGGARRAGVDSVLVADVPVGEGAPFSAAARRHGVAPVYIATGETVDDALEHLAREGDGYTYVVTRAGVTGADDAPTLASAHRGLVERLRAANAPPPVFGFGISGPDQVMQARACGASAVISGSAIVRALEQGGDAAGQHLVRTLRAACDRA